MLKRRKLLVLGGLGLSLTAYAGAALGEAAAQPTPKGWSYEIRNGQRVPKANRITNPDGSWREEQRQGHCVTVKEMSKAGEYKETRQCNPGKPS